MTDSAGRGSVSEEVKSRPVVTVLSFVVGNSLSVTGKVQEKAFNFLVDTGSAITIVSSSAFSQLKSLDSRLEEVPYDVRLADGQDLLVQGQADMEITLGPLKVIHKVVVANIKQEVILGIDFLSAHDCKLDIRRALLHVNGVKVNMWEEKTDHPKCCRVVLRQGEVVPAKSEKLVSARVIRRGNEAQYNIFEASPRVRERTGVMFGRSLVDISVGSVVFRLFNPSDKDVELKEGMTVGSCIPVLECIPSPRSEVTVNNVGKENPDNTGDIVLPPKLEELLDRNLNPEQVARLKCKLVEYCDIFTGEDGTLGRINLVESDAINKVQENPGGNTKVVHFSRLKQYVGKPVSGWEEPKVGDETVSGNDSDPDRCNETGFTEVNQDKVIPDSDSEEIGVVDPIGDTIPEYIAEPIEIGLEGHVSSGLKFELCRDQDVMPVQFGKECQPCAASVVGCDISSVDLMKSQPERNMVSEDTVKKLVNGKVHGSRNSQLTEQRIPNVKDQSNPLPAQGERPHCKERLIVVGTRPPDEFDKQSGGKLKESLWIIGTRPPDGHLSNPGITIVESPRVKY